MVLILSLQKVPLLQCFSIVLLTIVLMMFAATLKPLKEKPPPTIFFFFNYGFVLILAILNMSIAIQQVFSSQMVANDMIGWIIFVVIGINSGANFLFGTVPILYGIYQIFKRLRKKCKGSREKGKKTGAELELFKLLRELLS